MTKGVLVKLQGTSSSSLPKAAVPSGSSSTGRERLGQQGWRGSGSSRREENLLLLLLSQ